MTRKEMTLCDDSAICSSIEEILCPIKGSVKADAKPKRTADFKAKAKEESPECRDSNPDNVFAGIEQVSKAKRQRTADGGRPEADASRDGVQKVASKQILFEKSDEAIEKNPEEGITQNGGPAMQRPAIESEAFGGDHKSDEQGKGRNSRDQTRPELTERVRTGQPVRKDTAAFDFRHDECGGDDKNRNRTLP